MSFQFSICISGSPTRPTAASRGGSSKKRTLAGSTHTNITGNSGSEWGSACVANAPQVLLLAKVKTATCTRAWLLLQGPLPLAQLSYIFLTCVCPDILRPHQSSKSYFKHRFGALVLQSNGSASHLTRHQVTSSSHCLSLLVQCELPRAGVHFLI